MAPSQIVLVALLLAVCVRVLWREVIQATIVLALVAIFVGVLTLAVAGQRVLGS
jgi:hypothetical protein